MSLINLTPHAVNFVVDGQTVTVEPSGTIARVGSKTVKVGTVELDGLVLDLNQTVFGDVENVPEPNNKDLFLVSRLVKSALSDRNDLVCPDGQLRDEAGRVIGCTSLSL